MKESNVLIPIIFFVIYPSANCTPILFPSIMALALIPSKKRDWKYKFLVPPAPG